MREGEQHELPGMASVRGLHQHPPSRMADARALTRLALDEALPHILLLPTHDDRQRNRATYGLNAQPDASGRYARRETDR